MKLRDKFLPKMYCYSGSEMLTNTYNKEVAEENAKECEQIADEFTVEFVEWCGLRTVQITKSEWANWLPNAEGTLSTKELLEIFKKEKGL